MASHRTRRSKKAGLPPGTLLHVGVPSTAPVKLTALVYRSDRPCAVRELNSIQDALPLEPDTVTWINVDGTQKVVGPRRVADEELLLHPLL